MKHTFNARHIRLLLSAIAIAIASISALGRDRYNFNPGWLLKIGDDSSWSSPKFDDSDWKRVTLPHAFNEDEAFKVGIADLTDTIGWYRKHFRLPESAKGQKVFLEFEGVRQGGEFFINGHHLGTHENGVMAVGFDITPYVRLGKDNVLAVRTDNDWHYREKATGSSYGLLLQLSFLQL